MKTKRINYRHYLAIGITLFFLSLSFFIFPIAWTRFIESIKDLWNSFIFYFNELLDLDKMIYPSVIDLSSVDFVVPFGLPQTWQEFTILWKEYWRILFTSENLINYLSAFANFLYYASRYILLFGVPLILVVSLLFKNYISKHNNDYDKDSKPLQLHKKFTTNIYEPIRNWVYSFIGFIKEHKIYYKLWLLIWGWNFNIIV